MSPPSSYKQTHMNVVSWLVLRGARSRRQSIMRHHPDSADIDYRQLLSRAATQRLHILLPDSPSLDPSTQWEHDERALSRQKALLQLQQIGVSWEQFVRDVEEIENEVHVLRPTKYQGAREVMRRTVERNLYMQHSRREIELATGDDERRKTSAYWKASQEAHVRALRTFAAARTMSGSTRGIVSS
ncbi:hypothetical protein DE146DRAFT_132959 [Phaeosphaeria sp. MPI-PUGE-AT-0046c]|nr:hypothetical protein DE146DRAFT_132959 [Phaeosphaeria sp. MPI-PUGE-AT-0046c]